LLLVNGLQQVWPSGEALLSSWIDDELRS